MHDIAAFVPYSQQYEFVLHFHDDALTELLDDDGDETTKGVDGANAIATGLATANMIDTVDVNFILM
jgi:hypothetical protein